MLLATSSRSGVKVLHDRDGDLLVPLGKAYRAHAGVVGGVAWTGAAQLASCGHDGVVSVCSARGVPLHRLVPAAASGVAGAVRAALHAVAALDDLALVGAADGAVHAWRRTRTDASADWTPLSVLAPAATQSPVLAVALSPAATLTAEAATAGPVFVRSVTGTGLSSAHALSTDSDSVSAGAGSLRFSSLVPAMLAAGTSAGDLLLWAHVGGASAAADACYRVPQCHRAACTGVAFSPANRLLMCSAGLDRRLVFCDVEQRSVVRELVAVASLTAVAFRADGYTVAVGTSTGSVLLYDLRGTADTPIAKLPAHSPFACNSLAFLTPEDPALLAAVLAEPDTVTPVNARPATSALTTVGARRVVSALAGAPAPAPAAPNTQVRPAVPAVARAVTESVVVAPAQPVAAAVAVVVPPAASTPEARPQAGSATRTVRINVLNNHEIAPPSLEPSPIATPLGGALATPISRLQFRSGAGHTGGAGALEPASVPVTVSATGGAAGSAGKSETPIAFKLTAAPAGGTAANVDELREIVNEAVDEARNELHRDISDVYMAMTQHFSELFEAQSTAFRQLQEQNLVLLNEVVSLRAQLGEAKDRTTKRKAAPFK
jgi:protein NEDD1